MIWYRLDTRKNTQISLLRIFIERISQSSSFLLENDSCFQTQRWGAVWEAESEVDEALSQALLPVLLRSSLPNTKSRIFVGGWSKFSRYKVESWYCTENEGGTARVRNIQLPPNRSTEGQDQKDDKGESASSPLQTDDVATKDGIISAICRWIQRCRPLAPAVRARTTFNAHGSKVPNSIRTTGGVGLYHQKHRPGQRQLADSIRPGSIGSAVSKWKSHLEFQLHQQQFHHTRDANECSAKWNSP